MLCLLVILLAAVALARGEKIADLKPQGCVNDFAHVINSGAQDRLGALCNELLEKTGAALVVTTLNTTEEVPIQQFNVDLYQQWGIGKKGEDRGVSFLLAVDDRKYSIRVGYGLEPILPDGKVGGFGREMRLLLQQKDYSAAVLQISNQIASVIAQDRGVTLENAGHVPSSGAGRGNGGSFPTRLIAYLVFGVLFVIFHLISAAFRFLRGGPQYRRKTRGWGWWFFGDGGSFGSGGSNSGSWGGGGFGGGGGGDFGGFGGGSTGGGGADGSW